MLSPNTVTQKKPFDATPHADGLTQSRFIAIPPLNQIVPWLREQI